MDRSIDRAVSASNSQPMDNFSQDSLATTEHLVNQIVKSLVDYPQQVLVTTLKGDHTTVLELRVAKEDLGKVIGKQGRTAHAMRTLLSAVSSKAKMRTVLEIIE